MRKKLKKLLIGLGSSYMFFGNNCYAAGSGDGGINFGFIIGVVLVILVLALGYKMDNASDSTPKKKSKKKVDADKVDKKAVEPISEDMPYEEEPEERYEFEGDPTSQKRNIIQDIDDPDPYGVNDTSNQEPNFDDEPNNSPVDTSDEMYSDALEEDEEITPITEKKYDDLSDSEPSALNMEDAGTGASSETLVFNQPIGGISEDDYDNAEDNNASSDDDLFVKSTNDEVEQEDDLTTFTSASDNVKQDEEPETFFSSKEEVKDTELDVEEIDDTPSFSSREDEEDDSLNEDSKAEVVEDEEGFFSSASTTDLDSKEDKEDVSTEANYDVVDEIDKLNDDDDDDILYYTAKSMEETAKEVHSTFATKLEDAVVEAVPDEEPEYATLDVEEEPEEKYDSKTNALMNELEGLDDFDETDEDNNLNKKTYEILNDDFEQEDDLNTFTSASEKVEEDDDLNTFKSSSKEVEQDDLDVSTSTSDSTETDEDSDGFFSTKEDESPAVEKSNYVSHSSTYEPKEDDDFSFSKDMDEEQPSKTEDSDYLDDDLNTVSQEDDIEPLPSEEELEEIKNSFINQMENNLKNNNTNKKKKNK